MPLALVDENRQHLARAWLAAATKCVEHWDSHRQFTIAPRRIRKFQVAYPFAAHSINQVRAALTLINADMNYVARTNARVALEHALIAQWILLTYGGEEAVVNKAERHRRAALQDLKRVTDLPPDLVSELATPLVGIEIPKVQDICDRFDKGTRSVYSIYRQLSDSVHVSLGTVGAYMEIGNQGVSGLLSIARADKDSDLSLAVGWSATLAMFAIETLRKGRPFRKQIEDLAMEHSLPCNLRHADSMPHLQRRPRA